MAWCRPGDNPLSELMVVSLLTHICFTQPQWFKPHVVLQAYSGFIHRQVLIISCIITISVLLWYLIDSLDPVVACYVSVTLGGHNGCGVISTHINHQPYNHAPYNIQSIFVFALFWFVLCPLIGALEHLFYCLFAYIIFSHQYDHFSLKYMDI